ncbi:MAG: hypothetical protein A2Y48_02650 [Nitrospirae bacterium RIFCSPLOW2_12_42_9]|nr:MAG: hypothetical protein A3D21_02020 [Nitrospirae bacterium RIFCSPHIGHO2_02_FULL_42_12]OGW62374.1 MAG: hypothetical protein A2Y48_02650 [Nitrospirae bacterium RIFCSPLOW2_12_42_9]HBI23940.1 hypothetical protein [Nitrospiraceae bacterium]
MKKNPIYPNTPLVETVFEIRFTGEPAVECKRDEFFYKIRSKYPKVYVPKLKEAVQALALEPYHFRSEDDKTGVMIALNRFAFFTKEYKGFNSFKKETLMLMKIFTGMFKITKLNRTGLRYINIIPFARENDIIPVNNYLNFGINFPEVYPKQYNSLSIAFKALTEAGSITTRLENNVSIEGSQEVILLDFDYAKENNLSTSKLEHYLEESHKYTKQMFESLITDTYRSYLKGEAI